MLNTFGNSDTSVSSANALPLKLHSQSAFNPALTKIHAHAVLKHSKSSFRVLIATSPSTRLVGEA